QLFADLKVAGSVQAQAFPDRLPKAQRHPSLWAARLGRGGSHPVALSQRGGKLSGQKSGKSACPCGAALLRTAFRLRLETAPIFPAALFQEGGDQLVVVLGLGRELHEILRTE